MAEDMKPVEPVFKTQKLIDIVNQYSQDDESTVPISLKEMKTKELLEKMKAEKDKRDFMLLFNILMITVMIVSIFSIVLVFSLLDVIVLVLSLGYFIFVRRRLTQETLSLSSIKIDEESYLWHGFQLKEMRFTAVKLAYMLFFPLLLVVLVTIVLEDSVGYLLTNYLIALGLSTLTWFFFFMDDQQILENIESDLKTLQYLT